AYDENGNYAYYKKMTGNSSRRNYNILNELENSYTDQHTSGITVNANLKFNFTNWLNANAIISYTNSNAEIEGYWGEETYYAASLRGTEFGTIPTPAKTVIACYLSGELTRNETRSNSYTARLQVNANKYFGADRTA
ncbi:MAG: SusC/RagA family TonB-linked outer membrane protein, partial [Butyricimonas faecihominis]